jgi:hypothetical protein
MDRAPVATSERSTAVNIDSKIPLSVMDEPMAPPAVPQGIAETTSSNTVESETAQSMCLNEEDVVITEAEELLAHAEDFRLGFTGIRVGHDGFEPFSIAPDANLVGGWSE